MAESTAVADEQEGECVIMMINRSRTISVVAAFLLSITWLGAAHAAPIVVDWDVVPHDDTVLHFGDSQIYECTGSPYGNRSCRSLWDTGLTLEATLFSFYDDKFFDGTGLGGAAESSISEGDGVQRIRPECKTGLSPCFDSFSPLTLRMAGFSVGDIFPNLFVLSSRGGLAKAPSVDSIVSFNFAGSDWQNLEWIEVGFYLPQICEDDPPEGTETLCSGNYEKALEIQDLTFEAVAVPEPALLSLIAAGALGAGVRRRYRS